MSQAMRICRLIALSVAALPCAFAYIGEAPVIGGTATQITRADSSSLQFYLNNLVVGGATSSVSGATVISANSNPAAGVEAAMATWNNVGGSNIRFSALQTTTAVHTASDCKNVISIGSSAADLSVLGFVSAASPGVIAATANSYVTTAGPVCSPTITAPAGAIIDSDIILNPYVTFSTDNTANTSDLQAVVTHEFGHVFGMNHSGLLGATMYPFAAQHERRLSWDDKVFAAAYYPSGKKSLGTISGTVTLGSIPVKYGLIVATDVSGGGKTIGSVTAADGTYSVQVPAGTYNVYAEPFNSFFGAVNVYSFSGTLSTLDPTQATTAFQATFSGGNSTNPPVFTVTAGSSSTANISVVSGASPLTVPFYAILPGGGSGIPNGTQFPAISSAIPLAGGQSYDLVLSGTGLDSTITVGFIGTNVTLVGSPHVDPAGTINGNPIIRQTLMIGSQTNATVGSLWIIKGTNILPLSGVLDLEPMTPSVSNVQDAESARTSLTSGQWSAIYGNNLANGTRVWDATLDFTGGVATGAPLPLSLDGVSVTVNSVPAAVYLVCDLCSTPTTNSQINFLTPSNLSPGSATVVVTNGSTSSSTFTTTITQASPSFFYYAAGGNIYPSAVHIASGVLVGDPALLAGTEKAHPGETIEMFVNGIAAATGGIIVPVTAFTQQVTMTAGTTTLGTSAPYLVAAGEFQVNVTLPASLAPGNYTLTMSVPGGSTSTAGVTVILPVGP